MAFKVTPCVGTIDLEPVLEIPAGALVTGTEQGCLGVVHEVLGVATVEPDGSTRVMLRIVRLTTLRLIFGAPPSMPVPVDVYFWLAEGVGSWRDGYDRKGPVRFDGDGD